MNMRRITTILCLTAIMLLLAAPAFAQSTRDPFDPAIEPAPEAATTTTTGDPADGTGTTTEGTTEERSETAGLGEGLPNTGGATEPWVVAAYALIAIGGAAALGSRMMRTNS
jgi:hypothetical protein